MLPEICTTAGFDEAARAVLRHLRDHVPMGFWSVTRVENGHQTYLYLDDNCYDLRPGGQHTWDSSFCIHMAAGAAPRVAVDAQAVPAYAAAGVNELAAIGSYAGVRIDEPDGSLFGAICGLHPEVVGEGHPLGDAEDLLVLLGQLLTAVLAAERARDEARRLAMAAAVAAETDALTGLLNRRAWDRVLAEVEAEFDRLGDPTVIAITDLDRLKEINDSQGHAAGDDYIRTAARTLSAAVRGGDVVARLGGDEFGILLRQCDRRSAERRLAQIHAALEANGVPSSLGWAPITVLRGLPVAVAEADEAMYEAKRRRRLSQAVPRQRVAVEDRQRRQAREIDRLESTRSYGLAQAPATFFAGLDELAGLAALVCQTPTAAVTIVGEEHLHVIAGNGPIPPRRRRQGSFSAVVVDEGRPLIVTDMLADNRFPHLVNAASQWRAFAGVPLIGRDGLAIGTLNVLDVAVRDFTPDQLARLTTLACQVMTQLEQRRRDLDEHADHSEPTTSPERLRAALEDGELQPHFQPIVDLETGAVRGVEALLRWHHPELGLLPPARFMPAIEDSRLILPVGRHVLHESVRLLADLRAQGLAHQLHGVTVNVSPLQLVEPGFADHVLRELEAHQVPAGLLSLELTETSALADVATAVSELAILRRAGVHLAIDDYGTGHSSVMRLLELPATALKLDRGLTAKLPDDGRALTVVRSTLAMAADLGLAVVVEGIETEEQRACVLALGCRFGQGFLFHRPMPREQVLALLAAEVPEPASCGHRHEVHVWSDQRELAGWVAAGLAPALLAGGAGLVVATPERRAAVLAELARIGLDAGDLGERLVLRDAGELLATFMVDGQPDPQLFADHAGALMTGLVERHGRVTAYREMVAELWAQGNVSGALALEDGWNALAGDERVTLLCAYPAVTLEAHGTEQQARRMLEQHTFVAG